jgi:hypothetical protein
MDEFLMGVTSMVMYNADTVLTKYEETNLPLTTELTNPWIKAKEAVGTYNGNALDLMNQWTKEGGFFAQFNASGTINLQSPWNAGVTAANTFKNSVSTVMSDIVSNIRSNVSNITSYLGSVQSAYSGIITSAQRAMAEMEAANAAAAVFTSYTGTAGKSQSTSTYTPPAQVDSRILSKYKLTSDRVLALGYGPISLEKFEDLLRNYLIKYSNKFSKAQIWNTTSFERSIGDFGDNYVSGPMVIGQYAKGTTGIDKDQLAIVDEFGPELMLRANPATGRLDYVTRGTGIVPSDLTENLMEWGQFTPDAMNFGGGVNVNMINNAVNKPEFNLSFEALVKAERIDENTMPEVKKYVQQEINTLVKQMNYAIKGKGGR